MKSKIFAIKLTTLLASLTLFAGCAGSSNGDDLEVPTNLPPICRDIDFVANPDMREMCGVRKAHNKAYKNIPQQRYLIKPSETSIVKTGNKLELRFQNSLPLYLDGPIVNELMFNQEKRLERSRTITTTTKSTTRLPRKGPVSSRWESRPTLAVRTNSASASPN